MNKKLLYFVLTSFLIFNSVGAEEQVKNKKEGVQKQETYYYPYITGNISSKYNFSRALNHNINNYFNRKKNKSGFEIEGDLNVHLYNSVSLRNTTILRPVEKRVKNKNYTYSDYYGKEGYLERKNYSKEYDVVFEQLALEYKEEQFLLGFGKFNPTFGSAYNNKRYSGISGTKIAEEYELKEKIGLYVAMTLPMINIQANSFYDDNTFLTETLFQRRGSSRNNEIVGNTGKLNNFSLTADFVLQDIKFNAGIRRLATNDRDKEAENGYILGVEKIFDQTENCFGFAPFAEIAIFNNYLGYKNRDTKFFTANLPFFYDNWNIVGSYSFKQDENKRNKLYTYLTQISVGYKFENGLMIDVARNFSRESLIKSTTEKDSYKLNSWEVMFSYVIDFNDK